MRFSIFKRSYSKISNVLGIETSCDDTAAAIVSRSRVILAESKNDQWIIHKNMGRAKTSKSANQVSFSGGVIPDLARKLHNQNLIGCVSDCIEKMPNGWNDVNAIALTVKPGLEPCLWEGINFTKLLLNKYQLPFIPIHHMEAHALTSRLFDKKLDYPFLTLLISGGHCIIALVKDSESFYRLGESIDISPGNCLDKVARQLGLFELSKNDSKSGGELIESFAARNGDPNRFKSLINLTKNYCGKNKDCNFSFSGLLSSTFRLINHQLEESQTENNKSLLKEDIISDICSSLQYVIEYQLRDRLERALIFMNDYKSDIKIRSIVVSGGVASNLYIKSNLSKMANKYDLKLVVPPVKYCTDNGVMIAWNGCEKVFQHEHKSHRSNQNHSRIIYPKDQDNNFFDSLKPLGKCELGENIHDQIKILNLKIK